MPSWTSEEKQMFLEELGVEESGLDRLIKCSYAPAGPDLLPDRTDQDECRAWTIKKGTKAPQAAGKIHSDFERGFIRAEVIAYRRSRWSAAPWPLPRSQGTGS